MAASFTTTSISSIYRSLLGRTPSRQPDCRRRTSRRWIHPWLQQSRALSGFRSVRSDRPPALCRLHSQIVFKQPYRFRSRRRSRYKPCRRNAFSFSSPSRSRQSLGSIGLPSWATSRSCISLACSSSFVRIPSIITRVVGSLSLKKRINSR